MRFKHLLAAVLSLALCMMLCSTALAALEYVGITGGKATVYQKADKESKVLGTLAKNNYVTVLEIKDGWAKIKVDGKTGYTKSSNVSKTTRSAWVKSATLALYESNSTSSKKLKTLGYGTALKLAAVNDGWAQVKYDSKTYYCKYSSLTFTNPNGSGSKIYTKGTEATVYQYPSTSADKKTVTYSTTMTYYCTYNNEWCRVKVGSTYGYIKKSQLSTTKYDGYSTAKPADAKSVSVDWFKSSISSTFARNSTAIVTDVKTGISWKVKRTGGLYHVDAEPLTKDDTRAMKKACGSDFNTWDRRAVWVSIGNKKYAASINCMPHGSCKISGNGFDGVFCIHFTNSKTHCSEKVDGDHQACIKAALKAG